MFLHASRMEPAAHITHQEAKRCHVSNKVVAFVSRSEVSQPRRRYKHFLTYSRTPKTPVLWLVLIFQHILSLSLQSFCFTYTLGLAWGRKCATGSLDPDADFCTTPEDSPVDVGAMIVADKRGGGGGGTGGFIHCKYICLLVLQSAAKCVHKHTHVRHNVYKKNPWS